jgi:conjugal transfer pilus assembly protein TraF
MIRKLIWLKTGFRWAQAAIIVALVGSVSYAAFAQTTAAAAPSATSNKPSPQLSWWEESVWSNPERDYKWYPPEPAASPKAPESGATKPKEEAKRPLVALPLSAFKTTKEVQAHLNELKDVAVMQPTEKNVKEYYTFQLAVLNQGSTFADVARRVIWTNPEIDYSQKRPYNNAAAMTYASNQLSKERGSAVDIAQTHGLFFFFRSDCAYCHQMTPIVQMLAKQTGMQIVPVSLDGKGIEGFPNPMRDAGIGENFQVKAVPAVYLVERKTRAVQPVAFGMTALNSLTERIHVLMKTSPGQEF